jgi:hypothetical protein
VPKFKKDWAYVYITLDVFHSEMLRYGTRHVTLLLDPPSVLDLIRRNSVASQKMNVHRLAPAVSILKEG